MRITISIQHQENSQSTQKMYLKAEKVDFVGYVPFDKWNVWCCKCDTESLILKFVG